MDSLNAWCPYVRYSKEPDSVSTPMAWHGMAWHGVVYMHICGHDIDFNLPEVQYSVKDARDGSVAIKGGLAVHRCKNQNE